jgi:hypothetical protein
MAAQVIVPHLFAWEKDKSSHKNRFSWSAQNSRKVIVFVICPGHLSRNVNRRNSRRFFRYRRANTTGQHLLPYLNLYLQFPLVFGPIRPDGEACVSGSDRSQYWSLSTNSKPVEMDYNGFVRSQRNGPGWFPNERCAQPVTDGEKRKV